MIYNHSKSLTAITLITLLINGLSCGRTKVHNTLAITDVREPCAANYPLRNAYFGDLHVHTAYSFDAYAQNVRTTPTQAYAFAKGETIHLPPLNAEGKPTTPTKLERPLDFAAITDHAEFFGEVQVCLDPDASGYNSTICENYRKQNNNSTISFGLRLAAQIPERFSFCNGEEDIDCLKKASTVWTSIQEAAEQAYDRTSACSFSSFIAYEYSGAPNVSNMHRNVIFKNATVPQKPISYMDQPKETELWQDLKESCIDKKPPCDVLAIPHNSNLSNGNMFTPQYDPQATLEEKRALNTLRQSMEPLVEIYQHKADSECSNGLVTSFGQVDEACAFEKYHIPKDDFLDCGDTVGSMGMNGLGCVSQLDFVRGALIRGLQEEKATGVNPLKMGITAATDTHNGTPGAVDEWSWQGHVGRTDITVENRLDGPTLPPGSWRYSPGGLTGLWAEENSRDSLFEAMQRREAWGTSGPRIAVRFFGGWNFSDDLCSSDDLIAYSYAQGVPMGQDLPQQQNSLQTPTFVVQAYQDPGTPEHAGTPLKTIQIIKASVSADGDPSVQVFDVVSDDGDYLVDTSTCASSGSGASSLCQVWTDPNFDPSAQAYYYVRVLEYSTCRWSTYLCNTRLGAESPAACSDPQVPKLIQERAWTSPIWYSPASNGNEN